MPTASSSSSPQNQDQQARAIFSQGRPSTEASLACNVDDHRRTPTTGGLHSAMVTLDVVAESFDPDLFFECIGLMDSNNNIFDGDSSSPLPLNSVKEEMAENCPSGVADGQCPDFHFDAATKWSQERQKVDSAADPLDSVNMADSGDHQDQVDSKGLYSIVDYPGDAAVIRRHEIRESLRNLHHADEAIAREMKDQPHSIAKMNNRVLEQPPGSSGMATIADDVSCPISDLLMGTCTADSLQDSFPMLLTLSPSAVQPRRRHPSADDLLSDSPSSSSCGSGGVSFGAVIRPLPVLSVGEQTRAVLGVLNTNLPPETRNSTPRKRRGKQRKKLSPQTSRILKKEQNRLRSKAYRERKKLELDTLQQELRAARCELADGQCKVTATATTMKRKKSLFRN